MGEEMLYETSSTCTIGYMYMRQSNQKRADGSVLSHLQIAENVWDPVKKRSRVRIIYNCGRGDDPKATERLRRLARSILKRCSPEELVAEDPSLRVVDSWPYGDIYVLEHLWRQVGWRSDTSSCNASSRRGGSSRAGYVCARSITGRCIASTLISH